MAGNATILKIELDSFSTLLKLSLFILRQFNLQYNAGRIAFFAF